MAVLSMIKVFTTYKRNDDCKAVVYHLWFIEPVPVIKLVKNFFDMMSCIMDHWYYFGRIGAYKWTNKQEDYMVTCLASFSTLSSLILDLINELAVVY
jgi:hypothetical protein